MKKWTRRRPRLTDQVLDGILKATSAILAGEPGDVPDGEPWEAVERANAWAYGMREARAAERAAKEEKRALEERRRRTAAARARLEELRNDQKVRELLRDVR